MGDLTKNLSAHEFACPDGCGVGPINRLLPPILQLVLERFAALEKYSSWQMGIEVTSGCRCLKRNTAAGGSDTSKHLIFKASDFYLYDKLVGKHKRVPAIDVAEFLNLQFPLTFGIGKYNGRTHLDLRAAKARWDKR